MSRPGLNSPLESSLNGEGDIFSCCCDNLGGLQDVFSVSTLKPPSGWRPTQQIMHLVVNNHPAY